MKRFSFFLLLAAGLSLSVYADSYRDALSQYLLLGNVFDREQSQQLLKPIAESAFPDDTEQGTAVINQYAASQMQEDIVDIFLPSFRKHVSEQDLQELNKMVSSPHYAEIKERSLKVINNLDQSSEYQQFVAKYQEALMAILQGNTPQDIPVPAAVSPEYMKAFMSYYDVSKAGEIVLSSFRAMNSFFVESLRKQGVAEPEQIVAQISRYTERNIPRVMVSGFHNVLTEQDLQELTAVAFTPQYGRVMKAVTEVTGNLLLFSVALIEKMADWMDAHYPKYATQFRRTVDAVKQAL